MSQELERRRRLDRRGFLGAAAGVAAAGATATAMGPLARKGHAEGPECAEHAAEVPKIRRGAIHYTLPAQAWNTEAVFLDTIAFFKARNINAWEFAGGYPTVDGISLNSGTTRFPAGNPRAGLSGWEALGSYANTYGFRLVGTHDGPSPTTAANLGSALTKMNAWSCNQLGAGGGYPGGAINLPGSGTAITNPSAISAWQASAATMNSWGHAYQTNSGAGVLGVTPYGPGVFQGTALTSGRSCARYYRHFHSEQGKWIQNTGTKYDGHYISELIYTETDATVAFAQSDQCWLLEGLWMGGGGPGIGLQGPGDPNPGQGKNRLTQPDLIERYQDKVHTFHIKDLGPTDQGTGVRNLGDNDGPGSATAPYGAVPWEPGQDTVPFQQIFERFRHPELHEFLFERDGQSNTVTSSAYWRKLYTQAGDMFDKIVLDRKPEIVRLPFAIPSTAAEWATTANLPNGARPPSAGSGAPGPECPPELNGENQIGQTVNVSFRGTWSRFNETDADKYSYLWLRDGSPIDALYDGAALTGCGVVSQRSYKIQKEDAGHKLSCQVTAFNDDDAATSVISEVVTVEGGWSAAMDMDLAALSATVEGMGLAEKPTDRLTTKIRSIRHWLSLGENVCSDLDEFKGIVADLASHNKVTPEQAATLNSAADSIKAKSPTPC